MIVVNSFTIAFMKKIILILLLFFCSKNFGQLSYNFKQGYKFIKRAEKEIENGNLVKAEKLLEKANKSDYGFCGNAWASAKSQINLLQVQIFNERKEFDKSFSLLDSINACGIGADCEARDSLKIVTLILKFGKERVIQSFKNTKIVEKKEFDYDIQFSALISGLNYTFVFQDWDYRFQGEENKIFDPNDSKNQLMNLIKKHSYSKLLE